MNSIIEEIRLPILIICFIIFFLICFLHKLKILRCTKKVMGKVIENDIEKSSISPRYKMDFYIIVQYVIEDKLYQKKIQTGTNYDILNGNPTGFRFDGTSIDIFYNPKKYNDIYIKKIDDFTYRRTILYSIIGVVLINCWLYSDVIIMLIAKIVSIVMETLALIQK